MERSHDWLRQAERDLEQAQWALQGRFFEWVCFSAQQAAEKAVKALHEHAHGEGWGHTISKLLHELPAELRPDKTLLESALALDKLYIPTRYPNGFESGAPADFFTQHEAEEAIRHAQQIIVYCRERLS